MKLTSAHPTDRRGPEFLVISNLPGMYVIHRYSDSVNFQVLTITQRDQH